MSDGAEVFERHRGRLLAIAYRMLGEWAGAEDVAQEAWLRWNRAARADIRDPGAWLTTTTLRLALDALRAAKARRESYVGPWLPEPVTPDDARLVGSATPAERAELASDLSLALMHLLERLTPEECAALILHDAFDFDHREIAAVLAKSEAASRKLVSRARERVKAERPRFGATRRQHEDLLMRFAQASAGQDAAALAQLFAPDAIAYTDGGGRVRAALRPIQGGDKVARFVLGLARKYATLAAPKWRVVEAGGQPALLVGFPAEPPSLISLESDGATASALYMLRNPEKFARFGPL